LLNDEQPMTEYGVHTTNIFDLLSEEGVDPRKVQKKAAPAAAAAAGDQKKRQQGKPAPAGQAADQKKPALAKAQAAPGTSAPPIAGMPV